VGDKSKRNTCNYSYSGSKSSKLDAPPKFISSGIAKHPDANGAPERIKNQFEENVINKPHHYAILLSEQN
jgi:hypothetical protein